MKRTLALSAAIATAFSGLAVATASSSSAAPGCHERLPGIYVGVNDEGNTVFRPDARCGDLDRDVDRRVPRPSDPEPPAQQCHDVYVNGEVLGELCGEGLDDEEQPGGGHGSGPYRGGFGGFSFLGGGSPMKTPIVTVGEPEKVTT